MLLQWQLWQAYATSGCFSIWTFGTRKLVPLVTAMPRSSVGVAVAEGAVLSEVLGILLEQKNLSITLKYFCLSGGNCIGSIKHHKPTLQWLFTKDFRNNLLCVVLFYTVQHYVVCCTCPVFVTVAVVCVHAIHAPASILTRMLNTVINVMLTILPSEAWRQEKT